MCIRDRLEKGCFNNIGALDDFPVSSRFIRSAGSKPKVKEVADGDGNVSRELSGLSEDEASGKQVGRGTRKTVKSGSLDDSTVAESLWWCVPK